MKSLFRKFFRFFEFLLKTVGLRNIVLILFVVWFVRSPFFLRLRVFLGLASEEENGIPVSTNPLLTSTQRSIAWQYYMRGCRSKGYISSLKYGLLFALPDWAVSDKMFDKYKNLYLYGTGSDSK